MATVKEVFDAYCKENKLPPPTGKDYKNAGRIINTHFKRFWGISQPAEIVASAHYFLDKEDGIVVFSYPDIFINEMKGRIAFFLDQKAQRKDSVPKPKPPKGAIKKERKRIPYTPKQKPA